MSLWLLTQKNLKLLLRAKSSALIIIFAPLLIILLLGLSFDTTNNFGLTVGIHAPVFTPEIEEFVATIEKEYSVVKYTLIENCVLDVKTGLIHTCVALPPNLHVEENVPVQVEFHVDPSKINLVYAIQDTLKEKFNLKSLELSTDLTQNILSTLADAKQKVTTQQSSVGTIKEVSTSAASLTSSTKERLIGIDVVVSNSDQSITSLTDLRNNVNVSQTNVAKALIDLDASNISSSIKNELKSSLDIASAELLLATDLILENGTTGVTGIITKLQEDLDVTRTKLTDAGTAITNSNSNLETISTTLQDAIQSLDSVNSALGEAINVMQTQSDTNAQTVANPLITTITPVTEKSTYLNYLFPTLLILVIMFGSLLLGTTLVMTEKNSPAFLRNFFLPIKKVTFVMSTYITSIILTVIQIIVILGISLIFLPDAISSFPALALILFLTASIFSFLGMIIGYAFTSDETGILASVSLGSLLLFFSGSILPLEAASSAVRGIIQFNPFVIAERLVRGFLLFDASFSLVWMDILILVGYVIVLFFTILVLESLLHKHLVYRFMKHHHKRHKAKDKMTK